MAPVAQEEGGRRSFVYDEDFFKRIRFGCKRSAAALVPLLYERYSPASVVDVGCGEGWFGKAFEDAGCEDVVGIDRCDGVLENTVELDLVDPHQLRRLRRFDLALCLEVAEHLPEGSAPALVAELCRLADTVVFSAAIPGQGGDGHVNEQWPDYWVDLFARHNFTATDPRWAIWDDERISWWYRQNLIVFRAGAGYNDIPAVVHPSAWHHHGRGRSNFGAVRP